jgi:hypothetical protein
MINKESTDSWGWGNKIRAHKIKAQPEGTPLTSCGKIFRRRQKKDTLKQVLKARPCIIANEIQNFTSVIHGSVFIHPVFIILTKMSKNKLQGERQRKEKKKKISVTGWYYTIIFKVPL